jgi:predicted acylesterase/phospholipase RssA
MGGMEEEDGDGLFPSGFTLKLPEDEEEEKETVKRKQHEKPTKVGSGDHLTAKVPVPLCSAQEKCYNYDMNTATRKLYREMEDNINERTNSMMSLTSADEMLAMQMQRKELVRYRATGAKILSLDGGGMKGLIEVDVLDQLVQETGREIPELFDWVVATSTGAIIILGLLYAKKSLREIRQLYFRLKDEVFASDRFGIACNTSALEKLLVELFGTETTMEHDLESMPKVIITAVNKRNKAPELCYFSNCLKDNLCKTPVWKVARMASAAPLFFEEFEDHVDGGVLANNPCQVYLPTTII